MFSPDGSGILFFWAVVKAMAKKKDTADSRNSFKK